MTTQNPPAPQPVPPDPTGAPYPPGTPGGPPEPPQPATEPAKGSILQEFKEGGFEEVFGEMIDGQRE